MLEGDNIGPVTSFSLDGRLMHIDPAIVEPNLLRFLLENMGRSASSIYRISVFSSGTVDQIDSRNLFTGDDEEDEAYLQRHVEDLMTADYIEVERFAVAPTRMDPGVEYDV